MTVKEYHDRCIQNAVESEKSEKEGTAIFEFLMNATEVWSNNACLGYVIDALERSGYESAEIQKIVSVLKESFDFLSLDEAAEHYCHSQY